jgi:type I restriction enzyme, S subunit
MNAEDLLKHFDRIAEAPDAVAHLRRFILDLAVRGKLVEQDPNDEPASELLKRIQAEKKKLVKEGKIKPEKLIPSINELDQPFKIPKGWAWTRWNLVALKIGDIDHKMPETVSDGVPYVSPRDFLSENKINFEGAKKVSINDFIRLSAKIKPDIGDLIYPRYGTIGENRLVEEERDFLASYSCAVIKILKGFINPRFQYFFSISPYCKQQAKVAENKTTQANVGINSIQSFVFPLPPLAEQHRIVAKVDELMELCDRLQSAQQNRESQRDRLVAASLHHLNQSADGKFGDHARFYFNHLSQLTVRSEHIRELRQTILNLAVRGKLVPQDPSDEPASELLKRIQEDKARLVKEGKIKRDAALPPIGDTDSPFPLPSGWTWARFPEIGVFGRGKSKHRPRNDPSLFEGGTHLFVQTGDVARSNGIIKTHTSKYNDLGLTQSAKWPKGTLCITIAANIADTGILSFDACFPDSVVGFIPHSVFPEARYFEYFIRTAKSDLLEYAPATAQKNINLGILTAVLIPLPPLAELNRIVTKVDELMGLCDRLETQLTTTQTTSRQLLESLLHKALNPSV